MIAPGNHNFERFAALCNTLPGEARALRAGAYTIHPGACENPGLRADSIRPYRACAKNVLAWMFLLTFVNIYGILFSSYKYHRCTVQNEIWMCVSVLCQRYPRYAGETTWKTTSETTESTSQNNRLFLKTNPLLLLQKQKQKLLQRQQRKLSRKKIFLLVRRTSRPEREAFFSWTG